MLCILWGSLRKCLFPSFLSFPIFSHLDFSVLSSRMRLKIIWTHIFITLHFHMSKLSIPSNFSTSNLVFDTEIYCGGILAFSSTSSSRISTIRTYLNYKWTPEIVKTRTLMFKRAKLVTLVRYFTKQTPHLCPKWLKVLGTSLTRPRTSQKNHLFGQIWLSRLKKRILYLCKWNILLTSERIFHTIKWHGCWCGIIGPLCWWCGRWLSANMSIYISASFEARISALTSFSNKFFGETSASFIRLVLNSI
jgi:hypothetical protein